MQIWKRLGNIYCPEGNSSLIHSHAAVPFVTSIDGTVARIYFSARNSSNKSLISFLDFDLNNHKVIRINDAPVLEPGLPGFFDEDGVMGCDSIRINNRTFIYYIGWNRATTVPFRNALGMAELCNEKAERVYNGPILDRNPHDPCFVASCCVIRHSEQFIMYYISGLNWFMDQGKWNHRYHLKIATSPDGFTWTPTGKTAIDFRYPNEYAISVPRVHYINGKLRMWYSYRGGPESEFYRIGYAESSDGFNWERKDEQFSFSGDTGDWEKDMHCYPFIFYHEHQYYMLYNGNGYGQSGFGLAVLTSPL